MVRRTFTVIVLVGVSGILMPTVARAQSAIAGVVKDSRAAVLAGVSVEAASPALIEKARSTVTDAQGLFLIPDLREGSYTVTLTKPGFATLRMEGVELPADFTATLNLDMRVGGVEEIVTVSGKAFVVDVRKSDVRDAVEREKLDAVPTGRTYQSVTQNVTAVNRPDVGGSENFFSTFLTAHGSQTRDQTMDIDGLCATSGEGVGQFTAFYRNDADNETVVYTVSALPAEVSKGGVRVNMIGRAGGNQLRGTFSASETPGALESSNLKPEVIAAGLPTSRQVKRILYYDFTLGGPLKTDRIWFFTAWKWNRDQHRAAGAFRPDGSRSPDDAEHRDANVRLTFQATPRNKLSVYYARMFRRTLFQRFIGVNRPEEAAARHTTPIVYQANAIWTLPLSNRWLIEAGFSTTHSHPKIWPQPSVAYDPNVIPKFDFGLNQYRGAYSSRSDLYKGTKYYAGSATYVTGSHTVKAGAQARLVASRNTLTITGDKHLVQEYRNGVPSSVTVYATPADRLVHLSPDLGIYLQDSWKIRRLTVNYGLRYEYFYGVIDARDVPAGRFVPARHYDRIGGVPDWKSWSPRLGVVWDVFGDGRTAIKGTASRYAWGESVSYQELYAPSQIGGVNGSDRRSWNDLNGDDIAQDNEIGPPNNLKLGIAPALRPDPNMKRPHQWEYNLVLQREVIPRVGLQVGYFRRRYYGLFKQVNLALTPGDYTPLTVSSPLNGEPITVYNLNPAKRGLLDLLDTNTENNTEVYDGFDVVVNARLGGSTTLFGAITTGRSVEKTCEVEDPNKLRFCDQTGMIPFHTVIKLSGNTRLPYGVVFSGSLQSYPGDPIIPQAGSRDAGRPEAGLRMDWQVTPAAVPGLTQPLISVPLIPPGSKYLKRYNQVDSRFGKVFRLGRYSIEPRLDIFNVLNTDVIRRIIETYGRNYGRPLEIPQGRLFRFGMQVKF